MFLMFGHLTFFPRLALYRDALVGSACTLLSGIGLFLLRRGRHYLEKRCREFLGAAENQNEVSPDDSPPLEGTKMVTDDLEETTPKVVETPV